MEQFTKIPSIPEELAIDWVLRPFQRFAREEVSGGILLLVGAVVALAWANSPWSDAYHNLWETHLRVGFGNFVLNKPLHFWINDAVMAVFFFVIGLEIKREVMIGELSSVKQVALPMFAAAGGMLCPALIYLAFNRSGVEAHGWGIPMSTDIAFSLGVLALLGRRTPLALKLFLVAFAIADDIGAVVIIALFYTADISWANLAIAAGVLILLASFDKMGVRYSLVYALLGIVVWAVFLKSGVHATVAGILVAATIPSRVRINPEEFLSKCHILLNEFSRKGKHKQAGRTTVEQRAVLEELESVCKEVESPLQRMEHSLHPWVAFLIIPLFAVANAGVTLDGSLANTLTGSVALGILIGLGIGKSTGVILFVWIAVRLGLATLPPNVTWRQIYGVAWLGGIGFTMSLFITGLAFTDNALVSEAKIGTLAASMLCGAIGWMILRSPRQKYLEHQEEEVDLLVEAIQEALKTKGSQDRGNLIK